VHAAVPLFRVSEFVKVKRIASGGSSESCPVLGRGTRGDCTETGSFLLNVFLIQVKQGI